ncbi:MAG TPA: class I SAM-dependent methyltransferase [Thermomicrobiales bacterium]|jgi:SAM-dependent methyltransferase|nr:class I SAM-dependent methyltransferase [Thermomicrobiales bacterium]
MSAQPTANAPLEPAPDEVTEEWREAHLPSVFADWHPYIMRQQAASTAAIIAAAEVAPGFTVLDVGCGSGIPTLALAEAVGPSGRVVAVDPSPIFVAAARENARALGLANIEVVQASAAGLPFPGASFDAATCHMGAMFFPDLRAGLTRIRQTLRPGRRAAFAAWGPDADNTLFNSFWSAARPYLPPEAAQAPPPGPDTPAPMRFADAGSLGAALRDAGFADVRETTRRFDLVWPGPPATLRDFWLALTGLADRIPSERRDALRADVLASFRRFAAGDTVRLHAPIIIASGRT